MRKLFAIIGVVTAISLASLIFASQYVFADINTPLVQPDPGTDPYSIPPPSSFGKREFSFEDKQETYYWDGEDIVMVGGGLDRNTGNSGERFTGDNSKNTSGTFDIKDFAAYNEGEKCEHVDSEKTRYIELRVNSDNSLTLDLIGDGSDGATQGSGEVMWGDAVGIGVGPISVSGSNNCEYMLYNHFRYNTGASQILGDKGVKYEDWVKLQNRKNVYRAYRAQLLSEGLAFCDGKDNKRQDDLGGCLNAIATSFDKCYTQALNGKKVEEADMNSAGLDKLMDCMKNDPALLPYFDSPEAIEEFIRNVLANAQIPEDVKPKLNPTEETEEEVEGKTTCSIEKIGWILCPTFTFISKVTDQLFKILRGWFTVRPFEQNVNNQDTPPYQVWSKMLTIANVIFVLVFMFIIYAMITGGGLSAYNIKTLLPRLIITAVMVNASFYICAIAVDLSNIVGDSIYKIFLSLTSSAGIDDSIVDSGDSNYGTWESLTTSVVLAGGVLAGTVAIIANMAALAPIMLFALFAMLLTWLVLLLRQAIIIILVVIAPIAFAMFMLPNTKKWFDRWLKMFTELLFLYPIIALLFGASYFASVIIRESGAQQGDVLLTIFALGIQVIPLFITPLLIKFGGHIVNRFGGVINDKSKGPYDRAQKRAGEFKDDQKLKQRTWSAQRTDERSDNIYSALQRRGMRSAYKRNYRKSQLEQAKTLHNANNGASIARGSTGLFGGKDAKSYLQALLAEQAKSLEGKKVGAALTKLEQVYLSDNALTEISKSYNDALEEMAQQGTYAGKSVSDEDRAAAIQKLAGQGDLDQIHSLINKANSQSGSLTKLQREALAKGIQGSGISGSAVHLGGGAIEEIRTGQVKSVGALYSSAIDKGKYSPEAIAAQGAKSINGLIAAGASGAVTSGQLDKVRDNHKQVQSNDKLMSMVTSSAKEAWGRL
jgi:hypothetical protein